MLVADLNDGEAELCSAAAFIASLNAAIASIAAPTRSPAQPSVKPSGAACLARAYEVFRARVGHVELLVDYEGDAVSLTGEPRDNLLAITSVHPMRTQAVARLVARAGVSPTLITEMVRHGDLAETTYGGCRYYLRMLPGARRGPLAHDLGSS